MIIVADGARQQYRVLYLDCLHTRVTSAFNAAEDALLNPAVDKCVISKLILLDNLLYSFRSMAAKIDQGSRSSRG